MPPILKGPNNPNWKGGVSLQRDYANRYYHEKLKYNDKYKERRKKADKQRYWKDREGVMQKVEEWRQQNKEKVKCYYEKYKQKNKEHITEYQHKWYQKNRRKVKERQKAWAKTTQGRQYYRDWDRGHRCGLTVRLLQLLYEDNIKKYGTLTCGICKLSIKFGDDSVDHIVPRSKGGLGIYNNLQIAHRICNSKKGGKYYALYNRNIG